MSKRASLLLPLALALSLVSCGGGAATPEQALTQGYQALNAGDGPKALGLLEQAARELAQDPNAPRWKEIQIALVEAEALVDANRARDRFLKLAREERARFDASDFAKVGNQLFKVDMAVSIDVVDAGLREFGHEGDERLARLLDNIKDRALSTGDSSAQSKLAGLGYL